MESAISVGDSDVKPLQKKTKNKCAHKVAKQQTTERFFFFLTASVSSSGAQQCSTVSSHTTFSSDLRQ